VPHDHCACCYLRRKNFNEMELWKCAWPAGTGLLISRGEPTEKSTVELFEKTHGLHCCKFHICLFLSVLIKTNHTAHMYGGIKTLKHNLRTALRLAYHGCKNLTHTSKTHHVKRTQLIGSRFTCLLLFQTAKNRTQRNRRAKWCVRFKSGPSPESLQQGRIIFAQGDFTFRKLDKISTDLWCFIFQFEWLRTTNLRHIRTTNLRHKTQTHFCIFLLFPYFLSLWGVLWLPNWQSDFCLLVKITNISDFLSLGAVQTCTSTQ